MDAETKTYFEKFERRIQDFFIREMQALEHRLTSELASKTDLQEMRDGLVAVLASKEALAMVNRNLSDKIDRAYFGHA